MKTYASPHPWSDERPESLVVCCSDGRYHPHIEDFVRSHVSEKPDLIAIPGGPAVISPWASSFDGARVFEESLELLVSTHALTSIWLIAHQGCSFYRKKHGPMAPDELRDLQIKDLRKAREWLRDHHRDLEVQLTYAFLEDGRVLFQEINGV